MVIPCFYLPFLLPAEASGQYGRARWMVRPRLRPARLLVFCAAAAGLPPRRPRARPGFLRRQDYRKGEVLALHRYRPADLLGLKELRPHASGFAYLKPGGFLESSFIHLDNHAEWKNGFEVHTALNVTHEGVLERRLVLKLSWLFDVLR
jgi:hypothetical protein